MRERPEMQMVAQTPLDKEQKQYEVQEK